jgi:protein-S-isoprenylcysteine O-methyltransferase Ste14
MTVFQSIIPALWFVFIVYWGVSALSAKRSIASRAWWTQGLMRLGMVVVALSAIRIFGLGHALRMAQAYQTRSIVLGAIGMVVVAAGIGLAVYARVYLGRNWGMPMSRKEDPELVTGGPYAFVRHPIYTGIILAMLGSAIGESLFWALPLVLFAAYFVHCARQEEELMRAQFPEQYPDYMRRTNMIVPFVL